jgi:DNA-binding NarL/FixJ family response regulator
MHLHHARSRSWALVEGPRSARDDVGVTRVLVVDDHRMFADSLVRLLGDEPDLAVVGVAGTISDGIGVARTENPDIVLLDFRLPDGDAPDCIARLRDVAPDARVLVMTGLADESTFAAARGAGCAGVITKDKAAQELVAGIRAAAVGAPVDRAVIEAAPDLVPRSLSSREREVLAQLAAGGSTEEIAEGLHISPVTVRNHVQRILGKLGAHSRLEAVALGMRAGIIGPPPPGGVPTS